MAQVQDPTDPTAADWWAQNAPPASASVLGPTATATNPYAWDNGAAAPSQAPPGMHWDANMANFVPDTPGATTTTGGGAQPSTATGTQLPQSGYGGFGLAPSPYITPTYSGPSAPTAPTLTPFSAPTEADLEASPGYNSRLTAGLRAGNMSAAAQGTVLNGGTQKALARYGQDYASNEYNNLFGQSLATNQNNNNVAQTGFGDAFQTYQANYGQFSDAAARGLSGYQTNVTNTRNAGNDYWTQLNDLYQTGAGAASGSYKPGATA